MVGLVRRISLFGALLGALLGLALLPALASADWEEPVGGASPINTDPNRGADHSSLASIGGVPYVAWDEGAGGPSVELRVKRLNATGTAWESVGGVVNPSPTGTNPAPSLTSIGGVPYVAWTDNQTGADTDYDIRVSRLNGGAWEQVGGVVNGADDAFNPPTLVSIGGVPYVSWTEFVGPGDLGVRVSRFNGTTWEQVGGAVNTNYADVHRMTAIGGVPYVVWREFDGAHFQLRVARLNAAGTDWDELVGGASPINHDPNLDVAGIPDVIGIGGVPYVAWPEYDGAHFQLRASRLNGGETAWEELVGGPSPINHDPNGTAFSMRLAALGGVPYLTWSEFDGTHGNVWVKRLNGAGSEWEQVASTVNHDLLQFGLSPSLTSIGGVPFVGWGEVDSADNSQLRVARLEPDFLGASAGPNATSATLTMDLKTYGIEYPVGFEYGPGFASSTSTATTSGNFDTITRQVNGLKPSTTVNYRPFAIAGVTPRARGGSRSFRTSAPNGPGPQGPAGPAGPQGPPGRDAVVSCKVKKKRGKPKVKCKVTFPEVGATSARVKLVRHGRVYARGRATEGDASVRLRPRRELRSGRYRLVIVTVDADGERSVTRQPFAVG